MLLSLPHRSSPWRRATSSVQHEEGNPLRAAYAHFIRVSRIAFDVISSEKEGRHLRVVGISTYIIVSKLEVAKIYGKIHTNLNVVARTNTTNVFYKKLKNKYVISLKVV